jgi:hypothetical protein
VASAVEAKTGAVVWTGRIGGTHSASPVYADGRVYFFDEEGKTAVVEAGRTFKVLAENRLGDGYLASPAIAGKAFIVRSRSHLYRIEANTTAGQSADSVPLFNGKDLTGWHNINCAPGTWTVRDGVIHSTGAPICELRTDRMYENFVLDVEWMHEKPKGNAGVFIWSDALPARGQPFLRAVEVQVLDGRETANYTSHGDIFPIHGATMTPDRPHPNGWPRSLPSEKRARPAGEWNHYRITVDRGRITLEVNGKAVSGGYDISPRKGYIALESEGSPAQFKNLRIRELPSAGDLPAAQVATADEGYRSLYTGVDLSGWKATGPSIFKVADWQIAASGQGGGTLVTADDKGPRVFPAGADFFLDWRCGASQENEQPAPKEVTAEGGFSVEYPIADPRLKFSCRDRAPHQSEGNQWNRTSITSRDGSLVVMLNGHELDGPTKRLTNVRGPLGIRHEGGTITFANFFVRAAHTK